jgi:glycosyltransferase involved in cell wall biosynthesis
LNGAKTLEETIQSVINQTYPNVEYIIIDGSSTDGTLDIIKKYEDYIDYWVSEKDKGIYDAMNKGASVALGSWLYFLGSDDVCFTDAFQKIHKHLDSTKKAVYGNVIFKNKGIIYDGYFSPAKLIFQNICHQAIFYNKKIFNNYRYNTKYIIWADHALNLNIFSEVDFKYVEITVAIYNETGTSRKLLKDISFIKDRKKILKENLFKQDKDLYNIYLSFKKFFD